MKKLILLSMVVVLSLVFTQSGLAQSNFKFAYVDIQKVIFTSETGKAAIQRVKTFQEKRQQKITDLENELNELEKALSKQAFTLTDDAKYGKEEIIRTKKLELKRLLEDSEYELAKRKKGVLEEINTNIVKLIQQVAEEGAYSLVLEVTGGNIIYGDQTFDITDKIIAVYDKPAPASSP